MPWWIGTIVGAISLVVTNNLQRVLPMTLQSWGILIFPLFLCQLGFWYGFHNAKSFIVCWFIGSAMANSLGIIAGIVVFGETVSISMGCGICLIISGSYLLIR